MASTSTLSDIWTIIVSKPVLKAAGLGALSAICLRIFLKLVDHVSKPTPSSESSEQSEFTTDTTSQEQTPIRKSKLEKARGENDGDPIYIAVKDPYSDKTNVFDVSKSKDFYGPGAGYHLFTGRDSTFGLATSCLDPENQQGDLDTLTASQKDTHVQWYEKFLSKYPIVGFLVSDDYEPQTNVTTDTSASNESKKDA